MKKVIGGRRYDTETAEHIADGGNGYPIDDFNCCLEELYRKRTGEFFIYGYGGPYSKYCKWFSDNSCGFGEKITPITIDEAKAWVEKYLDGDQYEEIFGKVDESRVNFSANLDKSLYEKLKKEAEEKDITMTDIVIEALTKYLK